MTTVISSIGIGDNQKLSSLNLSVKETTSPSFSGNRLMNSSWPMFHHDTRHTGRSPYGPESTGNFPEVKWKLYMDDGGSFSSPSIDNSGTIYIGVLDLHKSFFAINPNGTEKWRYDIGEYVQSSPAIGTDGVIYFGSDNGNFYALYPNGTLKWCIDLGEGWVTSSPVIDTENVIYAASVDSCALRAIYPNGTIKWSYYATDSIYTSPAIDGNNTVYFGSNDGYLYAIYSNGMLKWKYYAGGQKGPVTPSIGDDGSIYFGGTSGDLFALYPNGTLHWKIRTGWIGESSPAIGIDGTIYVGEQNYYKIYCISKNGNIKWTFQTGDEILSSPAIDNNGIIYCGSDDGYLYALKPDGTLHWKFYIGYKIRGCSPVIDIDGTIFIAGWGSYIYALKVIKDNPPATPTITGQANGTVRHTYDYTVVSTDPDGDNVSYYIDWGDGSTTDWTGSYASGDEVVQSHKWTRRGTYEIKVKARDEHGMESDWGILRVTMPFSNDIPFTGFLQRLLERFPNAFPILRILFYENF